MSAPTLINLPPPPSNPETPSDMPGTPNSGTTSLSALSTTAIKDGQQGHAPSHLPGHHHASIASRNTLDAERADRISRLAGLERVATARSGGSSSSLAAGGTSNSPQVPGYFDPAQPPQLKERSTVGSASATGSVGGRTTWASGSDVYDPDKMSEDQEDGVSSIGGMSEEGNASIEGLGEGASSTISGPTSRLPARQGGIISPAAVRASLATGVTSPGSMMSGISGPGESLDSTRATDGSAYDSMATDTPDRSPIPAHVRNPSATGVETAERLMAQRRADTEAHSDLQSGMGERGN